MCTNTLVSPPLPLLSPGLFGHVRVHRALLPFFAHHSFQDRDHPGRLLILSAPNKWQHLLVTPTITRLGIGEHGNDCEYVLSLSKMLQILTIGFLLIRLNVLH